MVELLAKHSELHGDRTLSRALSDFKDEKLIERIGTKITMLNFDALLKMKN